MKKIGMLLGSILLWSIEASAQTPYFQGKTIRVVVGYPAGSAHDLWARLIAPQLTKHIPGNPATVVQIMPGAGSMTATNYIYSVAKPDGLTLGVNNAALYFEQLLKKKEVQYDWSKFTWVGSTTPTSAFCICGRTHPTKPSRTCARRPCRRSAARPARGIPAIICRDCSKKPSARSFKSSQVIRAARDIELAVERGEVQCRALPSKFSSAGSRLTPGAARIRCGFWYSRR